MHTKRSQGFATGWVDRPVNLAHATTANTPAGHTDTHRVIEITLGNGAKQRTAEREGLLPQAGPGFLIFLEGIDFHPPFVDRHGLDGHSGIDEFLHEIRQ